MSDGMRQFVDEKQRMTNGWQSEGGEKEQLKLDKKCIPSGMRQSTISL